MFFEDPIISLHANISNSARPNSSTRNRVPSSSTFKVWKVRSPAFLATLIFLVYTSHTALDYVGFDSARVPGVPLLWPLSSELYQSPWTLLSSTIGVGDAKLGFATVTAVLREILLLTPLLATVYTLKSSRIPWPRQMAWMYGSVFIAVVGVSLVFL